MSDQQVLRRNTSITANLYTALVSNAVRRVQLHRDFTDDQLADELFVSPETVANARNQRGKLSGPTLFNLLTLDPLALEGLLQHFDRRSVPIAAKCDTDALPGLSAAVHHLAVAQSPSSPSGPAISHGELLNMLPALEAAQEVLSGLIVRARRLVA